MRPHSPEPACDARHLPESPQPGDAPVIELCGISKSFGPVRANRDISLSIAHGSITALLGENGAGKSTLMSILSGRLQPDAGSIRAQGRQVHFRSPKDALRHGIGMVYQNFSLVESMTVAENVVLGQMSTPFFRPGRVQRLVAELVERYGLDLDPGARVANLSMGERQRVEIVKLLYRDSRVLILDEPTAVLTPQEAEHLFAAMRRMAAKGRAFVFISHKLQEVLDISDRIAILRQGEIVDVFEREHVPDKAELARRMLGRSVTAFPPALPGKSGGIVLEAEGLRGNGLDGVSFTLRRGEILAVAGVAGNGQKELVETVCGLIAPQAGRVRILARDWRQMYPAVPARGGLAYIPEDRLSRAVCPELSLAENFLLTTRKLFSDGIWLRRDAAYAEAEALIGRYTIKPGILTEPARSLSGGNLQKFVVARELYRTPKVIIAENPTQGLDVAATEEVWQRLLDARESAGILLVTGDVTEALTLADRVAVMFKGRFMDCFPRSDEARVASISMLMAGLSA